MKDALVQTNQREEEKFKSSEEVRVLLRQVRGKGNHTTFFMFKKVFVQTPVYLKGTSHV